MYAQRTAWQEDDTNNGKDRLRIQGDSLLNRPDILILGSDVILILNVIEHASAYTF